VDDDARFSILFTGWVTSAERYRVTSGEQRSRFCTRSLLLALLTTSVTL
jgi:hypothetical protein